ncbi:MAG: transposase [Bacteroidota bacterium]|nr:transposase [Bacteroidota bacterium]
MSQTDQRIKKAMYEVFGKKYLHQRCQWYKRENVVSYLKEEQKEYKKRLQRAYSEPTYSQAKQSLLEIREDLRQLNLSAVKSIDEGMEETLTLFKLGVSEIFGVSLGTTNSIENLNSLLARFINKVKYWKNSDQIFRWVGCGLIEAEGRMKKIRNFKSLYVLREKIMQTLKIKATKSYTRAASTFSYDIVTSSVNILPKAGIYLETANAYQLQGANAEGSGGTVIMGTMGIDLTYKMFSMDFDYQLPISQNFIGVQTENDYRFFLGLGYAFDL